MRKKHVRNSSVNINATKGWGGGTTGDGAEKVLKTVKTIVELRKSVRMREEENGYRVTVILKFTFTGINYSGLCHNIQNIPYVSFIIHLKGNHEMLSNPYFFFFFFA